MIKIDCLGEICPVPLLNVKKALPSIRAGETVLLVTDHSCACRSIRELCGHLGLGYQESEVFNGIWEITVSLAP